MAVLAVLNRYFFSPSRLKLFFRERVSKQQGILCGDGWYRIRYPLPMKKTVEQAETSGSGWAI